MKTIYLVRHAKSDWNMDDLADIDRPLNPRGYRDAHAMSRLMNDKKVLPDLIISSPATRAISTALIFCRNFKLPASEISIKENLYETPVHQYLEVIKNVDDRYKNIMLFAHNPTISNLASALTSPLTESLSTCSVVGIRFSKAFTEWKDLEKMNGELVFYDFPKNHI